MDGGLMCTPLRSLLAKNVDVLKEKLKRKTLSLHHWINLYETFNLNSLSTMCQSWRGTPSNKITYFLASDNGSSAWYKKTDTKIPRASSSWHQKKNFRLHYLQKISVTFLSHFGQIWNNVMKHSLNKFTSTKHELDWSNISKIYSFI